MGDGVHEATVLCDFDIVLVVQLQGGFFSPVTKFGVCSCVFPCDRALSSRDRWPRRHDFTSSLSTDYNDEHRIEDADLLPNSSSILLLFNGRETEKQAITP